jgi:hypothetical protein
MHLASSPYAARILINGTIYPPWYNVDEQAFQPAQSADMKQDSPTIAGTSPRSPSGSLFQLSSLVPATRQTRRDKDRASDSNPTPPPQRSHDSVGPKSACDAKKERANVFWEMEIRV